MTDQLSLWLTNSLNNLWLEREAFGWQAGCAEFLQDRIIVCEALSNTRKSAVFCDESEFLTNFEVFEWNTLPRQVYYIAWNKGGLITSSFPGSSLILPGNEVGLLVYNHPYWLIDGQNLKEDAHKQTEEKSNENFFFKKKVTFTNTRVNQ